MLKYFGFEMACNVAFAIFLATWFIARHVIYLTLCWSIYKNVPAFMGFGCYSGTTGEMLAADGTHDSWVSLVYPFRNIEGPICMSLRIKWTFLSFLLFLQLLSIVWFAMIIRVAINAIRTGAAEDSRSDDEEECEVGSSEESQPSGTSGAEKPNGTAIISNDPTSESYRQKSIMGSSSNQGHQVRIRTGRGRLSLSDQNDRKALLGRIGCDKPS
jgi:acyl-CoA-dependent ceramide synthase